MTPGQFFFPTAASTATLGSRPVLAGAPSPIAAVLVSDPGASSISAGAFPDASFATVLASTTADVVRSPTAAPSAVAAAKRQLVEAAQHEDPAAVAMSVPSAVSVVMMAVQPQNAQTDATGNVGAGAAVPDPAPPVAGVAGLLATASDLTASPAPVTDTEGAAAPGALASPGAVSVIAQVIPAPSPQAGSETAPATSSPVISPTPAAAAIPDANADKSPANAPPEAPVLEAGNEGVGTTVEGARSLAPQQQGRLDDGATMLTPQSQLQSQYQGDPTSAAVQAAPKGADTDAEPPAAQARASSQIDSTAAGVLAPDQTEATSATERPRDVAGIDYNTARKVGPAAVTPIPVAPAVAVKPAPAATETGPDSLESAEDPGGVAPHLASAAASAEKPTAITPTLKTAAPALTTAPVAPATLNSDHPAAASAVYSGAVEGSAQTADPQATEDSSAAATVPMSQAKPAPVPATEAAGVQLQTAPQQTDAVLASMARADASAVQETARVNTTPTAAPASPVPAPTPTVQVSARIIERHNGRSQRFELTLDPAELGKVEVRIEFGADKKVHAVISAHDSAALSDLMKGGKALEATLRDAGMDVADGGVKFEVANGGGNNAGANSAGGNTGGGRRPPWEFAQTFDMPLEPETDLTITQPTVWPPGRLNLVA